MAHQLGQPREEQVGLDAIDAAQRAAQVALHRFQPLAAPRGVLAGHHADGEVVSVPPVLVDRRRRQPLAHRSLSSVRREGPSAYFGQIRSLTM